MIEMKDFEQEYQDALRKSREQEAVRPISESATLMSRILFLRQPPFKIR